MEMVIYMFLLFSAALYATSDGNGCHHSAVNENGLLKLKCFLELQTGGQKKTFDWKYNSSSIEEDIVRVSYTLNSSNLTFVVRAQHVFFPDRLTETNIQCSEDNCTHYLQAEKVRLNESGVYTCEGVDPEENMCFNVKINVPPRPQLSVTSDGDYEVNDTIVASCWVDRVKPVNKLTMRLQLGDGAQHNYTEDMNSVTGDDYVSSAWINKTLTLDSSSIGKNLTCTAYWNNEEYNDAKVIGTIGKSTTTSAAFVTTDFTQDTSSKPTVSEGDANLSAIVGGASAGAVILIIIVIIIVCCVLRQKKKDPKPSSANGQLYADVDTSKKPPRIQPQRTNHVDDDEAAYAAHPGIPAKSNELMREMQGENPYDAVHMQHAEEEDKQPQANGAVKKTKPKEKKEKKKLEKREKEEKPAEYEDIPNTGTGPPQTAAKSMPQDERTYAAIAPRQAGKPVFIKNEEKTEYSAVHLRPRPDNEESDSD